MLGAGDFPSKASPALSALVPCPQVPKDVPLQQEGGQQDFNLLSPPFVPTLRDAPVIQATSRCAPRSPKFTPSPRAGPRLLFLRLLQPAGNESSSFFKPNSCSQARGMNLFRVDRDDNKNTRGKIQSPY